MSDPCAASNPAWMIAEFALDVPVQTSSPIPKAKMFEVMKEINSVLADDNVKIGDVIISRVANTDSDVVATANK